MLITFETIKTALNKQGLELELIDIDKDIFYYKLSNIEDNLIGSFDSLTEVIDYLYAF